MCLLFSTCHAIQSDSPQTVEEVAREGLLTRAEGGGQDGGGGGQAGGGGRLAGGRLYKPGGGGGQIGRQSSVVGRRSR